jgi:hypothetical protein
MDSAERGRDAANGGTICGLPNVIGGPQIVAR